MKIIRRILIVLGAFFILLIAAALVLPAVFKNDIKAAIDKAIAKNVNADVIFNVNDFSLSVFRHFPNMTAEIKNLGVFNRAPFAGEHLFVVEKLDVEINLLDVLFGKQLRIKGISLVKPQINISVLKDGRANYNISFPSKDTVVVASEPSKFSFGIDHWQIVDGDIMYDDKMLGYLLIIKGLDHSGSGDFSQSIFDLKTHTTADTITTSYGAMELLSKKSAEIKATITISENFTKFTFKDNTAKVNDFSISADGWFKMNANDYSMDITFNSPDNSFKSLLSIVPGMYTNEFGKIETKGDLAFSGFVRGPYSEKQLPAFNANLVVKDAMFKYPGLPAAITNISMDAMVDNKDGVLAHTLVDLKKLHLDFGSDPVDARLLLENLTTYKMDGSLKARLNLAELNKMFPMQGLDMRGLYSIDASARGIYDSARKIIPSINAAMTLNDGYVKSSKFPIPLEGMNVSATVKNTSGKMAETKIAIDKFSMTLDGEKLEASMTLENLSDYTWSVRGKGAVDLEKITKIFPISGVALAGKIKAAIETSGKMSDLTAKRYDKLPTTGTLSLIDFRFSSKTVPYAVTISRAQASFDPRKMELKEMVGTVGKSDFNVAGAVSNYLPYVLKNETITGRVTLNSSLFDLNEFMTSSSAQSTTADTSSLRVLPVPKNIDFTLAAAAKTVKMMDLIMSDASGDIVVKNGVADLAGVKFSLLGGAFGMNGSYDTKDIKHPKFDVGLTIDHMSIQQASTSFTFVKAYAPFAGLMTGTFATNMKMNGELKNDMTPDLATANGTGVLRIANGGLTQSKLVSSITSLTKLPDTDKIELKDLGLSFTIVNGKLVVKPFDLKIGSYPTTIGGTTALNGVLDYTIKMVVPAGKTGAQYQTFINQYAGTKNSTSDIPVTIGVAGTYADLKTTLMMDQQKRQAADAVVNAGKDAIQKAVSGTQAQAAVDKLLGKKTDTTKVHDTAKVVAPAGRVNQVLQNKLQNLLKKKH